MMYQQNYFVFVLKQKIKTKHNKTKHNKTKAKPNTTKPDKNQTKRHYKNIKHKKSEKPNG